MIIGLGNDFNSLTCLGWANLGASFAIGDDRVSAIWSDYGTGVIPRNVIIDQEGVVRYNTYGFNETAIAAILDELLSTAVVNDGGLLPESPQLLSSYPNPFNAETQLAFQLGIAGRVELTLYNARGVAVRQLLSTELAEGYHSVIWNARDDLGSDLPSGVYMAQLKSASGQSTRKLVLLK